MGSVNIVSLLLFALILMFSACSKGSGSVIPSLDNDGTYASIESAPILVSDIDLDRTPAAGWGTLGLFQLHLDPHNLTGELCNIRQGMLPDVLEVVDITNFLQLAPCTDCVKLQSVSLDDDGNLVASVGIKHPFEEGDPFKPITGKNRGDLHVFNVEGIVVSNNPATSFPGIGRSAANFRLLNASGYTGYLDPVLDNIYPSAASIHPYILHFDDYSQGNFDPGNPMGFDSVTIPHPSGNLVMPMGSDYDFKDYVFDLPDEPMDFIFAIGCTYAVSSASKSERFNPEFRIPQHNKKAASEVHVEIVENSLRGGIETSDCIINIKVLDISHGVDVEPNVLDKMYAQSNISRIIVEVSGVTALPVIESSPTPISGSGRDPEDPLTYELTFTNSGLAPEGSYLGLVKVHDSYPPGLNESLLLNGMDGITRVDPVVNPLEGLFEIDEFATYAVFEVSVALDTESPVCDIQSNPPGPNVFVEQTITLDGSGSYDPDGTIESYEWDFDYDHITFNVDDTGAIVQTSYMTEGNFTAALRVNDNLSASSICTVDFEVTESTLPSDFIQIDDIPFGRNCTIVEDYNGVLHAFYGKPAVQTDQNSNIIWAYSTDLGHTWHGHKIIHETQSGVDDFHTVRSSSMMVMPYASADDPVIYTAFYQANWTTNYRRIAAGKLDISDLNNPVFDTVVVRTAGQAGYTYNGAQIVARSDNKLMMYYMEYRGTGNFNPMYKFAYFDDLPEHITPTREFYGNTIDGRFIYVYNSTSPILAVDSNDNIIFTLSGRFHGINNHGFVPSGLTDYNTGYGSALLRYNNSGNYNSGDNWSFIQHYGRSGMMMYWDNRTQAISIDKNNDIHWVFEYQTDGYGPYGNDGGNYYMVYATCPTTSEWGNITYMDPVHPDMTDNGPNYLAEFVHASIDSNSQGRVYITYQKASAVPEIYYTYYDSGTWADPILMTVPPLDEGYYPYMFISSWDGMYTVFNDAADDGNPWLMVIDTRM